MYTNANNKTFYEDEFAAVTLLNVEKNRVSFILDSISIETISPNWQGKLNPEAGGGYVSEDGVIRVSKDNRSIRFSLNVNQSFAVYDMAIVEGFKPSKKLQKRTQ